MKRALVLLVGLLTACSNSVPTSENAEETTFSHNGETADVTPSPSETSESSTMGSAPLSLGEAQEIDLSGLLGDKFTSVEGAISTESGLYPIVASDEGERGIVELATAGEARFGWVALVDKSAQVALATRGSEQLVYIADHNSLSTLDMESGQTHRLGYIDEYLGVWDGYAVVTRAGKVSLINPDKSEDTDVSGSDTYLRGAYLIHDNTAYSLATQRSWDIEGNCVGAGDDLVCSGTNVVAWSADGAEKWRNEHPATLRGESTSVSVDDIATLIDGGADTVVVGISHIGGQCDQCTEDTDLSHYPLIVTSNSVVNAETGKELAHTQGSYSWATDKVVEVHPDHKKISVYQVMSGKP